MSSALAVQLQSPDALLRPGAVTLIVRDLDGVTRYYEDGTLKSTESGSVSAS